MSREIVPFAFEPEYKEGEYVSDDSSNESDSSNAQADADEDRLASTDWCECDCCELVWSWNLCRRVHAVRKVQLSKKDCLIL